MSTHKKEIVNKRLFGVFWHQSLLEILLGCSNVDCSLQLLLTVVVIVHQLVIPQYKPTHLPVSAEE